MEKYNYLSLENSREAIVREEARLTEVKARLQSYRDSVIWSIGGLVIFTFCFGLVWIIGKWPGKEGFYISGVLLALAFFCFTRINEKLGDVHVKRRMIKTHKRVLKYDDLK